MSRSKLHDFEILTRLGSGSFGTVYKVRRIVDDNLYVIKNVRIIELSFKEQSEAINEVQILAQLKSPFVVRYYDSFIEKECLHIVMEFCNRGDLQNLIKKAKEKNVTCLKEDVIWNISLQVILGLYYLHKKHILHRDLKSANVFLMKDDSKANYLVKIGDLGVAKLMDTSTALANTIVGTPYYLSPELCADMPYRDKSDCWAFGVLLYECCTLQHPFEARNQCALIMKIIEAQVKPPSSPSISAELVALIMWLLQKDPALRPSIKDVVNEEVVRRKIEQHNFEFPPELLQSPVTNHLSPKAPSQQPPIDKKSSFKSKVQHNEEAQSGNQRTVMTSAQRSGSGKMSSSGSDAPAAGVVRGDRVRGGSKRQLNDKVLTRHQVPRPMVSTSSRAAHTPPSHLDDEKASGGDPMRRTQSKMTKEQDEFSRDLGGQNDGEVADPKSRRDPLREDKDQKYESGGEQYEEEGFEEYDSHDDHPVHTYHDEDSVEVDKPLSTPRLPAHPTAAETLKSLKAGSSATWTNDFLSHPSHPLAATDMFHQTDGTTQSNPWNGNIEDSHDSSEWNPVWTENRGVIAGSHGKGVTLAGTRVAELGVAEQSIDEEDALQERESDLYDRAAYISTSQGSEDLGEEDDYEQQMEELLVHINDAKERAESTFGADLFGRVYQLLSNQMDMPIQTETQFDHNNTGELGPKGFNLVKELERSVSDSGHSLELACEAVFGVKVLLALESKYDKLKAMNFAFHK